VVGTPAVAAEFEFQKVTSTAGRFTAEMPGEPKERTNEIGKGAAQVRAVSLTVVPTPGVDYRVAYHDYPATALRVNPQAMLTGVRDGNVGKGGKLIEDKAIVLGKTRVPGRAFLIETEAFYYRMRVFLAGRRLYQVIVTGPQEAVTSKDADRFLDSFALTK
jgi:hypothetical protein